MTRRIAISILGLSIAYFLLTALITPYANYLVKLPSWWYPTFGQSNASALTWLHMVSALFLMACALPIAATISRLFPTDWKFVSIGVGLVGAAAILAPTIWLVLSGGMDGVRQINVFFLSTTIDAAKYTFFPFLFTALIRKAVPSNNALHEQT